MTTTIGNLRVWYWHRMSMLDRSGWVVSRIEPPENRKADRIVSHHKTQEEALAAARRYNKGAKANERYFRTGTVKESD